MAQRIGYIGLGDMGAPIAWRLFEAGYDLTVLNRSRAKMQPFVDAGAHAAANPNAIGGCCDTVFLCLDRPEAVEAVLFGGDGLIDGRQRTRHVVDNSTIDPEMAREIAVRAAERGVAYLDAPVTGGSAGARAGKLVTMVGGERAAVEAVAPLLASFAHRITHMGDSGAGMAGKLLNQTLLFAAIGAIGEAMNLADRLGVSRDRLCAALEGGAGDSVALRAYAQARDGERDGPVPQLIDHVAAALGGGIDPSIPGRFDVALKDAGIIRDLGQRAGAPTPMIDSFAEIVRRLNGGG